MMQQTDIGQETTIRPQTRFPLLVCLLTLLIIGFVTFALLPKTTPHSVDANTYLSGAISLAQGQGYHAATQLDHPPVTIYPPLNSFYLSLVWRLNPDFPSNIVTLNLGMMALGLGVCACLFVLLHRMDLPLIITTLLTLTLGLSPSWLTLQTFLFSDVLLTLFACFLWLLWWREDKQPTPTMYWLTGLLLSLSILTRTAALPWIGAAGLILLWRFRFSRTWQWAAVLLLPFLACIWWRHWSASGYSYGNYFQMSLQETGGLRKYFTDTLSQAWKYLGGEHAIEMLSPAFKRLGVGRFTQNLPATLVAVIKVFTAVCAFGLMVLTGIGCRAKWNRLTPYILLPIGLYLLELIVWPFPLGYRVLLPLLPVFLAWIWAGYMTVGSKWLPAPKLTRLAAVMLVGNLLLNGVLAVRLEREYAYPEKLTEIKEMADWVTKNTSVSNRIAIDAIVPQTHLHFMTQRLFIGGDAGYMPWLRPELSVEYLIAGADEEELWLKPEMKARQIFQTSGGKFRVYQLSVPAK